MSLLSPQAFTTDSTASADWPTSTPKWLRDKSRRLTAAMRLDRASSCEASSEKLCINNLNEIHGEKVSAMDTTQVRLLSPVVKDDAQRSFYGFEHFANPFVPLVFLTIFHLTFFLCIIAVVLQALLLTQLLISAGAFSG